VTMLGEEQTEDPLDAIRAGNRRTP
jgi:hypothetical protein